MTVDAALPTIDPFSSEALADPMSFLRRVRDTTPVAWIPDLGAHLLMRHADVAAALKDNRLVTGVMAQGLDWLGEQEQAELLPVRRSMERWMGRATTEDHRRVQHLLKRYFTPATVSALRPRIREFTNELIDAVASNGRMEVVADLAYPLPANVIAEMLGMPVADRELLRTWSRDILTLFQVASIEELRVAQRSVLEMQDYLRPLVDDRRRRPREDLLTVFAAAERDGVVDEEEIVANCVLLLFSGHATTSGLIANGVLLLLENPDQLALLRSDPDRTPAAVEEMVRMAGPATVVSRVTAEEVELAGQVFPAGRRIYLAGGIANRDPEVFTEPERFDITRAPARNLGFGAGAYYCLGAALARVEADECFRILLGRCPDIRLAAPPVQVAIPPLNHQVESLEVAFGVGSG
jgi:cytochrome P450